MERKCWSQQEGPPRVETAAAAALSSIRIVLKAFSKIQKDREDSPRTNTSSFAVQLHGYFTRTQFLPQMAHTNTGASTASGFLALVLLPISNVSICPALVSCLCLTWASAQQKHSLSLKILLEWHLSMGLLPLLVVKKLNKLPLRLIWFILSQLEKVLVWFPLRYTKQKKH